MSSAKNFSALFYEQKRKSYDLCALKGQSQVLPLYLDSIRIYTIGDKKGRKSVQDSCDVKDPRQV